MYVNMRVLYNRKRQRIYGRKFQYSMNFKCFRRICKWHACIHWFIGISMSRLIHFKRLVCVCMWIYPDYDEIQLDTDYTNIVKPEYIFSLSLLQPSILFNDLAIGSKYLRSILRLLRQFWMIFSHWIVCSLIKPRKFGIKRGIEVITANRST